MSARPHAPEKKKNEAPYPMTNADHRPNVNSTIFADQRGLDFTYVTFCACFLR